MHPSTSGSSKLRNWLNRNWLESLLLLILAAAVTWLINTGRALIGPAAPKPTATPIPLPPTTTPTPTMVPAPAALTFDGQQALLVAGRLTALGPRPSGSPANVAARELISEALTRYGWQVQQQDFEYNGLALQTVIGHWVPPGLSSTYTSTLVILAAHYDTRPTADREPDPQRRNQPVPGANDGASGPAVLVELARVLDKKQLRFPVWLVFLDGEALGEERSWAYGPGTQELLRHLPTSPRALIRLNMVGGATARFFQESYSDKKLTERLWHIARELGYEQWFVPQTRHTLSGTLRLRAAGIPVANLIDLDYPFWHTMQDTDEQISAESLQRVGEVLERFVEQWPEG